MQDDRKAKLEEMEQLQEALGRVDQELAQYADSDPTKVEAMSESESLQHRKQSNRLCHPGVCAEECTMGVVMKRALLPPGMYRVCPKYISCLCLPVLAMVPVQWV